MARLEKGKGTRKRTVELRRRGALLTMDEVDGPSVMLTGFRRYPSESAAQAGLAREVARVHGEGLAPADDEAKALVASLPAKSPKTPSLPLRQDVYVYNEATGFMVTSLRMAGKALEEGSAAWKKAVAKGDILPVSLYQDDPFVVRVVVGDDLREDEAEEWVSRIDAWLDLRDGKLCVTGGAPLVSDDYEPDDSYYDQFVRTLDVPKGRYRASVYAYVPGGINGAAALDHLAGGYDAAEPAESWWRRTRGDAPVPAWIRAWRGTAPPEEGDADLVGFLLHLTPVETAPEDGLSAVGADGWFAITEHARKPERCPGGLEARDVTGHLEGSAGEWLFAHDVLGSAAELAPSKIAGGPVEVAVGDAGLLARLPWFCSRLAIPAFRAKLPADAVFDFEQPCPEGALVVPAEAGVGFIFSNDLQPTEMVAAAGGLGNALRSLPDGSELELVTLVPESFGADPEAGRHRYQGVVSDGAWHVSKSYPRLTATTLRRALDLAREVAGGEGLAVSGDDEGKSILRWAKGNFGLYLDDNPAEVAGGVLRLREPDPKVLALYGVAAFAVRFGDTWPVSDLRDEDEKSGEGTDDDEHGGGDPWDLDEPPRGPEALRAASGRVWFHTMGLLWTDALAQAVKAEEPKLRGSGFHHVVDLLCDRFPHVVIRGYARRDGVTWAAHLMSAPSTLRLEFSTAFPDGASLLTSRDASLVERPDGRTYRQSFADAEPKELLAKHEARLAELEATHGPPLRTVPTALGFAEYVEASLVRQLDA